jgi:hypothetical protein
MDRYNKSISYFLLKNIKLFGHMEKKYELVI